MIVTVLLIGLFDLVRVFLIGFEKRAYKSKTKEN